MSHFWTCEKCRIKVGIDYDRCPMCDNRPKYLRHKHRDKFSNEIANDRRQFIRNASTNVARSRDPRRRQASGWHIDRGGMRRPKREYDR